MESKAVTTEEQTIIKNILSLTVGSDMRAIYGFWTDICHAMETVNPSDVEASRAKKTAIAVADRIKKSIVDGTKNSIDPSSFPIDFDNPVLDFLGMSQLIDSTHPEVIAEKRRNRIRSDFSTKITKKQEKVQELICKILLVASDAQTVTGSIQATNVYMD